MESNVYDVTDWKTPGKPVDPQYDIGAVINSIIADIKQRQTDAADKRSPRAVLGEKVLNRQCRHGRILALFGSARSQRPITLAKTNKRLGREVQSDSPPCFYAPARAFWAAIC